MIGTWDVSAAAVPHLRLSPFEHIVNLTSLGGQRPLGSSIPYAVSKAAVDHMTRLLASTVGPEIRVNAVAPGFVDTHGRVVGTNYARTWQDRCPCVAQPPPTTSRSQSSDFTGRPTSRGKYSRSTAGCTCADGGHVEVPTRR